MTAGTVFIFATVALLIGLSKGGLGGPVPISLTTPLLTLVLPVSQAVGVVLPLLLFADIFALYVYWGKWDIHYIRLMLPAAVVGIVLGTLVLSGLPNDILRRLIGGFTLMAVLYKVLNAQLASITYRPRSWHGYFAGWAAGFGSSLANSGAPPFTAYLLLQPQMNPISFIGTTTLFFAILNASKIPGYFSLNVIDLELVLSILWCVPLVPFGVWLGRRIIERMRPEVFEWLMLVLLFMASLYLLFAQTPQ